MEDYTPSAAEVYMSRFSEKRVAGDIVREMDAHGLPRRRRAMLIILATLACGLIGNFVFNKIEVAAVLWTVTIAGGR